jgi:predicted Fe-S protein YdhL (DUF1289 family)
MAIESPCTGICRIEPRNGLCEGCLRTIDEIIAWPTADDATRWAVLDRLPERAAAGREGFRTG